MDKKKEYLKQIAQDMVEHLLTMPDNTSICTREMLTLIGGPVLSDSDLFDVDDFFFQEAEKNGYIVDTSEHTGLVEGLPFNLDATFRNKKALLSKFSSLPATEVTSSDGGKYYVKKYVETKAVETSEEVELFTERRTLHLYIIPPHQITGTIEPKNHRLTFVTISGKGEIEYSRGMPLLTEKLYYRKKAELFDESCIIKNTSDKNLVLFVVDIDDSQYIATI